MKYPCDEHPVSVNFIDSFVHEKFSLSCEDALQVVLDNEIDTRGLQQLATDCDVNPIKAAAVQELNVLESVPEDASFVDLPVTHAKLLPSLVQAPKLEMKILPSRSKNVFLGKNETLSVIISNRLSALQEETLVQKHKQATKEVESTNDGEIQSLATSKLFKVNGHRLKPLYEGSQVETVEDLELIELD